MVVDEPLIRVDESLIKVDEPPLSCRRRASERASAREKQREMTAKAVHRVSFVTLGRGMMKCAYCCVVENSLSREGGCCTHVYSGCVCHVNCVRFVPHTDARERREAKGESVTVYDVVGH